MLNKGVNMLVTAAGTPRAPNAKLVQQAWHLFDARNVPVGRLAQRVTVLLMGKYKPTYLPHKDEGDVVVVVNAKEIKLTGDRWDKKIYRWHTGYPGGLKEVTARKWRDEHPERLIQRAVRGMLPKNSFRKYRMNRLRIYPGMDHPHTAQFAFNGAKRLIAEEYKMNQWKTFTRPMKEGDRTEDLVFDEEMFENYVPQDPYRKRRFEETAQKKDDYKQAWLEFSRNKKFTLVDRSEAD